MALGLFSNLKDGIEIIFFSSIVYYFSLWLKKDKTNNLLIYFVCYCAIFSFAVLLNLSTIISFLIYSAPIILILFIIFHQELLQRNFITLTNMPISTLEANEWQEELIRATLHAINNKKQIICVIENQADIKPFLHSSILFNTPITQELISLLIDSSGFEQDNLLWCNTHGKLIGINGEWRITSHEMWQTQTVNELPTWKQYALLMTLKTDTIIFKANPNKRAFDVVIKGTNYENLTAHQILLLLKKHIAVPSSYKGELNNDHIIKKHNSEQPNH